MTNKNSEEKFEPFLLRPAAIEKLWGGNRLNCDFSKGVNSNQLAETWECSTHPDGPSIVASGIFEGQTLLKVLNEHTEFLGEHSIFLGELPILIKFIDANQDLSVQVHPDDEYARIHENNQNGKTEMWYVLDAYKDAKLIYGLQHDISKEVLKKSIVDGSIEKYLQKITVKKGDVFFVESGTIHAIGSGILIAEIQQNSNLTYRLYDYNRVDKNGNKRDLHIEKALEVSNLAASKEPSQPMRILKYSQGCASELICRCKYFQVERLLVNTERTRKLFEFSSSILSFEVYLCINGCGIMLYNRDKVIVIFKGDCIFVPANSTCIRLHGKMEFLKVSC